MGKDFIQDVDNAIELEVEGYDNEFNVHRIAQNVVGVVDGPHGLDSKAIDIIKERIEVYKQAQ